jgi:hypothetical protein
MDRLNHSKFLELLDKKTEEVTPQDSMTAFTRHYVCRRCLTFYMRDYRRNENDIYDEMMEADLEKNGWKRKGR